MTFPIFSCIFLHFLHFPSIFLHFPVFCLFPAIFSHLWFTLPYRSRCVQRIPPLCGSSHLNFVWLLSI